MANEDVAASQSKQPGSVDHVVASGAENPRPYSINGNTTNGASGRVPRIQEEPTPFVGAPTAVVPTSAGGQHQFSATSVYPAAGTMALTGPQFGGQPVPVTYQLEQPQLPINNYLQPQPGIGVPAHGARGQRNFSRETSGGSYNGQQGISPNSEQQLQPFYQAGPPHDVSQPRSGFMQPNGPSGLSPYGSMGVPALQAPMAYEHQMAQQGMPYPSPRGSGQPFINDVRQDQALQNRRNFDSNGSTSLQDTPHRRNKASPYTRDNPSQRQRQTLRDGNRRGGFSGQRHRNFSPEQAYEQNTYVGIGLHQPNNFASTSQRVMSSQGGYQGQPPFPYDAPGPAFMGNQPQFNGGQYQNSFVQPTMQPVPQSFQPVWYAAPPPERSNAQTSPPGEVRRSTNPEISVTAPTQSSEESKDVSQSGDSRATDTPRPSKPHPQKKYTDDVRFLQTDNGSSQQALSVAPKADIQEPESQPSTEGAPASTTVNDEATKVQVNDLATPQDGTVRRKSREYLGYALDGHHSQDSAGTSQQLNRLVNNATQVSASSTLQGPRASSNGSKGLQKSLESQAGAKSRLPFDHTSQANDASHSFPTSNNNAYMRHHYYTDQSGDRIRDHLKLWVSSRGLTDKKLREILQSCPGIVDIQMKFPFSWESDQDPRSKPFAFIQ